MKKLIVLLLCTILWFAGCKKQREDGIYAEILTDKGIMVAKLFAKEAPVTVTNFVGLAEGSIKNSARGAGVPFYNGLSFHRVEENFVIQGGDPKGDGSGNPGYRFPDEIHPQLRHSSAGILAMANSGPHSNGCQFYITLKDQPNLDDKYNVFGELIEGLDVPAKIVKGDLIKSIKIIRVGKQAEELKVDQETFKKLVEARFEEINKQAMDAITQQEKVLLEKWPNPVKLESGLMYVLQKEGKGEKPNKGDIVHVHYVGTLLDGTEFDSSRKRNEPIAFPIGMGRVIRGWDEALLDMKPGEQRTLLIHPNLGYGASGRGNVIPPFSFLIFDVELMKVEKAPATPPPSGTPGT